VRFERWAATRRPAGRNLAAAAQHLSRTTFDMDITDSSRPRAPSGHFGAILLTFLAGERAKLHMISVEELPSVPASIDEVIETKTEENHKFHDVLAQARETSKKKGSSSTPRSSPVTQSRPWLPASTRRKRTCWWSALWVIQRSMSGSSAAPQIASCGWRHAPCWSQNDKRQ